MLACSKFSLTTFPFQGVPVPSKGTKREYDIVLNEDSEKVPRAFQIVSCDQDRDRLPPNISHTAVKPVCELKIDLTKLKVVSGRKNAGIGIGAGNRTAGGGVGKLADLFNALTRNKKVDKASTEETATPTSPTVSPPTPPSTTTSATGPKETSFDLFMLIGAADLRFEVKPRGEADTLASSEHDQIDVAWAADGGGATTATRWTADRERERDGSGATQDLLLKRA
jgi:hypothetical protein